VFQAHVVDSLPRTGTGKVRRTALVQMLLDGAFENRPQPAV
jgi:acyl-coenzyme A synthetase/AMP-(fatty) acid ligase